jgi:hypothetical protein
VSKAHLENLSKGAKPSLHAAPPDWDTLQALVQRAADALVDARNEANSLATRFAAAYGAAFWLARAPDLPNASIISKPDSTRDRSRGSTPGC